MACQYGYAGHKSPVLVQPKDLYDLPYTVNIILARSIHGDARRDQRFQPTYIPDIFFSSLHIRVSPCLVGEVELVIVGTENVPN
jgi:hypothetical protein